MIELFIVASRYHISIFITFSEMNDSSQHFSLRKSLVSIFDEKYQLQNVGEYRHFDTDTVVAVPLLRENKKVKLRITFVLLITSLRMSNIQEILIIDFENSEFCHN